MVAALFDTCILIDYLNGLPEARDELARHDDIAISVISWMETMVGAPVGFEEATRAFLAGFKQITLTPDIAESSVRIRRDNKLRLPDAIIRASAEVSGRLLVTRDEKAFGLASVGVRIPYKVTN